MRNTPPVLDSPLVNRLERDAMPSGSTVQVMSKVESEGLNLNLRGMASF